MSHVAPQQETAVGGKLSQGACAWPAAVHEPDTDVLTYDGGGTLEKVLALADSVVASNMQSRSSYRVPENSNNTGADNAGRVLRAVVLVLCCDTGAAQPAADVLTSPQRAVDWVRGAVNKAVESARHTSTWHRSECEMDADTLQKVLALAGTFNRVARGGAYSSVH